MPIRVYPAETLDRLGKIPPDVMPFGEYAKGRTYLWRPNYPPADQIWQLGYTTTPTGNNVAEHDMNKQWDNLGMDETWLNLRGIYIRAYRADATQQRAVATKQPIDLTNVNNVSFLVTGIGTESLYCIVGGTQMGGYTSYDVRVGMVAPQALRLATADVSALTGSYYLKLIALASGNGTSAILWCFGVILH